MNTSMYEDAAPAAPDDSQLGTISALAMRQVDLENEIERIEKELANKKRDLRKVQEIDLPEAMAAAGCKSFTLPDGHGITIKEDISASLAEGKKAPAIAWLKEHGYGDIVSEDVMISFGKGQEAAAVQLVEELVGAGLFPKRTTNVNTATLKSLIRELLEKGQEVPLETLGAFQWRKAIIK